MSLARVPLEDRLHSVDVIGCDPSVLSDIVNAWGNSLTQFLSSQQAAVTDVGTPASTPALLPAAAATPAPQAVGALIPKGQRNATLYKCAVKLLKRYGYSQGAYDLYLAEACKCIPLLSEDEVQSIWGSAAKFYVEAIVTSPDYIPPEVFNAPTASNAAGNVHPVSGGPANPAPSNSGEDVPPPMRYMPDDFTDIGEAVTLKRNFGDKLIFSKSLGYLVYTGTHWKANDTGARQDAQILTELQLHEAHMAVHFWSHASPDPASGLNEDSIKLEFDEAKNYLSFVLNRRKSSNISATLREYTAFSQVDIADLDADPYLLCTPQATYDLRQGLAGARPNALGDYITKVTKYPPSNIGAPIWTDFLNTVFCGDAELISYVQLICGLVAIGQVKVETLFIAYGSGRNGKSTFWNVIGHVLGDYFGHISAQTLAISKYSSSSVGVEMANLRGKRLCIASESREGSLLNEATLKQVTSTDDIFGNPKYKNPFSFVPSHTLVLYTNHLPKVQAMDEGTWRRLTVIPFNATIPPSNDKKNYAEYLEKNCGESIMAWIIEGAKKVIELDYNLPTPACVKKAISMYRSDNDWLQHFLDQCCEDGAGYEASAEELYQTYVQYTRTTGSFTKSAADFYKELNTRSYQSYKKQNRKFYKGLKIASNP